MIKRDEDSAELVGLSFGDGSFIPRKNKNTRRFQLRGDKTEDRDHYEQRIIPLFNKIVMYPIFKRNVATIEDSKNNSYGIALESSKVEQEFTDLGIPLGEKVELIVPPWIKKNKRYSIKFIKGLFDTDGSVNCEKNYSLRNPAKYTKIKASISNTSQELITQVSKLLRDLQIKHLVNKNVSKEKNRRDAYKIVVDGGINVRQWFKIIGSENPKHITKFKIWCRYGLLPPKTSLKQRKEMLKKGISTKQYSADMPERSNGLESSKNLANLRC